MKLEFFKYSQFDRQPKAWKLDGFTLDNINLIVGENASGKSKFLNCLKGLAFILSRAKKIPFKSGNFEVHFNKNGKKIVYFLRYEEGKVVREKLIIDSKTFLDRGPKGRGTITAIQLQKEIRFQAPDDEIAALARRDSIQHPFFEDLYHWGIDLVHFYFGTELGKTHYAKFTGKELKEEVDLSDTNKVVAVFKIGQQRFRHRFVSAIKKDMASIGYQLTNIRLGTPTSIIFVDELSLPSPPVGLIVKERDLKCETDQQDMSQGMFRALSLIIQLNYAQMAHIPSCILIDDVGEGLDYERSTSLIKLLIRKSEKTNVQLIMSTNDRFVMNNVPLKYWSVMYRVRNRSLVLSYKNSPTVFDNFELTGLSNFDFFTSKFFLGRRRIVLK
jgi:energy-coupling factor transporter ATP-binding protein EcfA2